MSRSVGGTASGRAVTWAWNLAHDPPPADIRHATSRLVLDAVGVAVAGARSGAVDGVLAVSHRTAGSGPATLLDGGGPVAVEDAALGNALLLACLDLDDRHALTGLRTSAAVLPAALAVAEQVDATGMDLLAAYLAGVEVACRLALAARDGFAAHGFDTTSVVGPTASALSVSWLRDLDPRVAQHAVGLAADLAAGAVGGPAERLHAATAARAAVLAADLAAAGATAAPDAWEGADGLIANHANLAVTPDELTDSLGDLWEVTGVALQRHPCPPAAHASVDAARSLVADGIRPVDIVEVVAVVHPEVLERLCGPPPGGPATAPGPDLAAGEPVTGSDAGPTAPDDPAPATLAWYVATTLVDGGLGTDSLSGPRRSRPQVHELASRVRCEVAEHVHGPAASQPGHLRVLLRDGEEIAVMAPGGVGGPEHPLTDEELVDRFVVNCGGRDGAAELAGRILALEDEPSVTDLAAEAARLSG